MKVVRHHAVADFLDRAGAWLESAEAENNLILGIAAYFKSYVGQLTAEPYFLTLEDSGAIVGGKSFCCLYTDLANSTSNSIYQKIGYRPVCDVQDWIFE